VSSDPILISGVSKRIGQQSCPGQSHPVIRGPAGRENKDQLDGGRHLKH